MVPEGLSVGILRKFGRGSRRSRRQSSVPSQFGVDQDLMQDYQRHVRNENAI